jgi:hypothetical protein
LALTLDRGAACAHTWGMYSVKRAYQELDDLRAQLQKLGTRIQWLENDLRRSGYAKPVDDPVADTARILWDEHWRVGTVLEGCIEARYSAITDRDADNHPVPIWFVGPDLWCKPSRVHDAVCRLSQEYPLPRIKAALAPLHQGQSTYRVGKTVVNAVLLDADLALAAYAKAMADRAAYEAEAASRRSTPEDWLRGINAHRAAKGESTFASVAEMRAALTPKAP